MWLYSFSIILSIQCCCFPDIILPWTELGRMTNQFSALKKKKKKSELMLNLCINFQTRFLRKKSNQLFRDEAIERRYLPSTSTFPPMPSKCKNIKRSQWAHWILWPQLQNIQKRGDSQTHLFQELEKYNCSRIISFQVEFWFYWYNYWLYSWMYIIDNRIRLAVLIFLNR